MSFKFKPLYLIYAIVIAAPALVTVTYIIAASLGHVPWCIPPIQGCTDITHTGILPPESYIFRFGVIPIATLMALLFYFFKEWLENIAGKKLLNAQISFYLALGACIFLDASTSLLQGKEDTLIHVHAIFATSFFILMLVSQALYTFEDFRLRQIPIKTALWIRIGTMILQFILLVLRISQWISTEAEANHAIEWLLTLTFIFWYASFIFERHTIFTNDYQRK